MAPSAVDAVIFDIDGMLVGTNEIHVEACQDAFRELGHDVRRARIRPEIGKGGDKLDPANLLARLPQALRLRHRTVRL